MRPVVLLIPMALSLPGAAQAPTQRAVLAMGTTLTLSVKGRTQGVEPALATVAELEARCSTWRPESLWSRFNAGTAGPLPEGDQALLRQVMTASKATEGCFDPALGRLIEAWGLRAGLRVPSPEILTAARAASGLDHLQEGPGGLQLTDGAWLEEGGFLKGHALDLMREKLVKGGATAGLLDFGGQLLVWGAAKAVSLADPKDRQRPRLSFRLRNASVSTSGASERGRHILDPRTGQPCEAWGSAVALRPTGLEADIFSTALYVMGPDRGLAWAEAHGVAAAFLLNDGTVRLTAPFRALYPRTH